MVKSSLKMIKQMLDTHEDTGLRGMAITLTGQSMVMPANQCQPKSQPWVSSVAWLSAFFSNYRSLFVQIYLWWCLEIDWVLINFHSSFWFWLVVFWNLITIYVGFRWRLHLLTMTRSSFLIGWVNFSRDVWMTRGVLTVRRQLPLLVLFRMTTTQVQSSTTVVIHSSFCIQLWLCSRVKTICKVELFWFSKKLFEAFYFAWKLWASSI